MEKKVKVKEADLYSAFIEVPYTQGAQVRITQCYLQITPYLPLPRKHSPDGASPDWGCGHLIAAYYSFIYPKGWKAELAWVAGYAMRQFTCRRQSPIPVLTGLDVEQLRWSRPTRYRYTKPPTRQRDSHHERNVNLFRVSCIGKGNPISTIQCWPCQLLTAIPPSLWPIKRAPAPASM